MLYVILCAYSSSSLGFCYLALSRDSHPQSANHLMSLPAQQEQLLGPRSVVFGGQLREERWGPWFKLADNESLAQLHTKFWCKSMVSEEAEWCRAKKSIDDDRGDVSAGKLSSWTLIWMRGMMRSFLGATSSITLVILKDLDSHRLYTDIRLL